MPRERGDSFHGCAVDGDLHLWIGTEQIMTNIIWLSGHERLVDDIVRAENDMLVDAGGNSYVDLEAGVWCTPLGHGHPEILRVMAEQAARITHTGFCYGSAEVENAAREILSLHGMTGGKCVFLCSGSEAVEYGVRVAQSFSPLPLLMTMADSYFGAYGSAHRKEEGQWFCFDWKGCADCNLHDQCNDACEHWAAIPFDKIGGFLFEPGSASGLVRFPPDKLIRSIVAEVKANDGLLLVNEVTTGVGRTGKWFGYQHYGLSPDIVAMGKGIGNGYPVSVTAVAPRVAERLADHPVPYAQSHMNDPLGAVIVRTVLKVIHEEALIARSREIAALLMTGLEAIKARTGLITALRARGLMIAIALQDDARAARTTRTHRTLVQRGYIVAQRPGLNVLRLDPALTIEKKAIEGFLEVFEDVLANRK
jgi:4-aminobutyrate aminotransferase-like enzyme